MDGTGTTVPPKPGKEGTAQLFDGKNNTKLCVGKGGKVNVTATWTYKSDRRVIVNNYGLTSANDCNNRHPSGWEFVASNDGKTWDVLDVRSGEFFTAPRQEKTSILRTASRITSISTTSTNSRTLPFLLGRIQDVLLKTSN